MVKLILVTHGDMARAMLETASKICSFEQGSIDVFTVSGKINLESMACEIKQRLDAKGTIILVDVFGGTSCNMTASLTHGMPNVHVICGVNLNMLLAALNYRGELDADALAKKIMEDGLKSVVSATEKFK